MHSVFLEKSPEVFRGHLQDCLKHLGQCVSNHFPKASKGVREARLPIAQFCGVDEGTVKRWLDGTSGFVGTPRINIMCCLDMLGYRVIELESIQEKRELLELIGYGVITAEDVAQILGYSGAQRIYRVLSDTEGMGRDKLDKMYALCQAKRPELVQRKEEALAKCQLGFPLMATFEQRKVSAVMNIMEGLLLMLEGSELGQQFEVSIHDLSPHEKNVVLRLADVFCSFPSKMAKGRQGEKDE